MFAIRCANAFLAPWLAFGSLFAAACASSTAVPATPPKFEDVIVTGGHFFDEKRMHDVEFKTYSPAGTKERLPLVIVPPAAGEDRNSHEAIGQALARHGFMSVHLSSDDVAFVIERLAVSTTADLNRIAVVRRAGRGFTVECIRPAGRACRAEIMRYLRPSPLPPLPARGERGQG